MLEIGPRPKYFPLLKMYFLPSGPLFPSHYSSPVSLTTFTALVHKVSYSYNLKKNHKFFTRKIPGCHKMAQV